MTDAAYVRVEVFRVGYVDRLLDGRPGTAAVPAADIDSEGAADRVPDRRRDLETAAAGERGDVRTADGWTPTSRSRFPIAPAPESRRRYWWAVQVWDERGDASLAQRPELAGDARGILFSTRVGSGRPSGSPPRTPRCGPISREAGLEWLWSRDTHRTVPIPAGLRPAPRRGRRASCSR